MMTFAATRHLPWLLNTPKCIWAKNAVTYHRCI